jgi:hypothetical protein
MRLPSFIVVTIGLLSGLGLAVSPAHAQATRTWVSGVGDDANPCSRTAPCKTFAGAISKTAAHGVINVLDPGGFGAVTITKAITIENEGENGGILVSGTNGVVVNAGAGDVVILRGLTFHGVGTGLSGVKFLAGAALHVESCTIEGFLNAGIEMTGGAELYVQDVLVRNIGTSTGPGIYVHPGSGRAVLDRVRVENSAGGIRFESVIGHVRDSVSAGHGVNGISAAAGARVTVEHSTSSNNGGAGILADGPTTLVMLNDSTVTYNMTGLSTPNGGTILSFGNNRIVENAANGAPSGLFPLQ